MNVPCMTTHAKEGCSVSTTLVDTSAFQRALSSILVRTVSRCRCRTILSLLSHQTSLSPRGVLLKAFGAHQDLLQMSRTSAKVISATQKLFPLSPCTDIWLWEVPWKIGFLFCFKVLYSNTWCKHTVISGSGADILLKREIGLCQQH